MHHDFKTPDSEQQGLFDNKPPAPHFNGPTYEPKKDQKRLSTQMKNIRNYMLNHGGFRTLEEIASLFNYPETSVSAQLRHLRKPKFGAFIVNRRKRSLNLSEYQVVK